jgi:hypothetical protein
MGRQRVEQRQRAALQRDDVTEEGPRSRRPAEPRLSRRHVFDRTGAGRFVPRLRCQVMHDEDNDGRFPDESTVEVRYLARSGRSRDTGCPCWSSELVMWLNRRMLIPGGLRRR